MNDRASPGILILRISIGDRVVPERTIGDEAGTVFEVIFEVAMDTLLCGVGFSVGVNDLMA